MLQAVPPSTVVWGVPTPLQAPHWGLIPSRSGARISHDRSRAALHHRPPCEAVLQQRPGSGLRCSSSGASSQIGWGPVPLRIAACDAMVTRKPMPCVAHLLPSLSLPEGSLKLRGSSRAFGASRAIQSAVTLPANDCPALLKLSQPPGFQQRVPRLFEMSLEIRSAATLGARHCLVQRSCCLLRLRQVHATLLGGPLYPTPSTLAPCATA